MAYIAALSALTFQWKLMNGGRRPRLVAWWAVSVACLVATASVTSITLFVLWSVLLSVVSWLSSRRSIWTAGLLLVFSLSAAGAYLVWSNLAAATEALGRDPTLTGRTEIWRVVWQLVESNFWFGYGWNAWALGNPVGDSLRSALGFNVTHAHNGYLNVALELGIVGLALLVWLLVLLLVKSLSRVAHKNAFLWMFVVIGMIVSASMAENRAFLNLGWFLIVAIGLYVGRHRSIERPTSASQGTD
jgi:exopolysaccharide production protein ExoQ